MAPAGVPLARSCQPAYDWQKVSHPVVRTFPQPPSLEGAHFDEPPNHWPQLLKPSDIGLAPGRRVLSTSCTMPQEARLHCVRKNVITCTRRRQRVIQQQVCFQAVPTQMPMSVGDMTISANWESPDG